MEEVVIVSGTRTAIGAFGGGHSSSGEFSGLMEKMCWFFSVDYDGNIPCEIGCSSHFG